MDILVSELEWDARGYAFITITPSCRIAIERDRKPGHFDIYCDVLQEENAPKPAVIGEKVLDVYTDNTASWWVIGSWINVEGLLAAQCVVDEILSKVKPDEARSAA